MFSSLQERVVWNSFLPGNAKYASETAHVQSVKLPLPSCVKNPGLAAVQQCAQNASSVDLDLGIFRQLLVGPYSLSQLENGSNSLADALV